MSELIKMLAEAEAELRDAKAAASPPDHPRRFLEFDAFAAAIRLRALCDAAEALQRCR